MGKLYGYLLTLLSFARSAFDIRPIFFLGGLAMLGYGLHLWLPCVAFSVCGVLLMGTGYLMRDKA